MAEPVPWWRDGVLYQIYPRSFADSNGDGHGDLPGLIAKLDYLEWLGVDGIWLNPVTPSPNADWGYDVSDYTAVHPDYGTLDDVDRLIAEAGRRGIRVVLDIVPNHTSDRHPWFEESRASRAAPKRDWYVWRDPRPDGSPPNNWRSVFGGDAWELDERTRQLYLHIFLAQQPDLDWWCDDVRDAFDEILRFWFDRGVAGFRIDVAHALIKDRDLRDNPPLAGATKPAEIRIGQRLVYNQNRPEVHEIWRRWRRLVDEYPEPPLLLGETYVMELESLAAFYGSGVDELHLALNFPFLNADLRELRPIVERTEELVPRASWPVWQASNHDHVRFATRWCGGDEGLTRCALIVLLALRGTPILYYGDELGMPETDVPRDRLRDPVGIRFWPEEQGRDGCRTPMPWTADGGFTDAGVEPWLPLGDAAACNVEAQRDDPRSTLHFTRDLIALRRELAPLRRGPYAPLVAPEGCWAWSRADGVVAAVNLGDSTAEVAVAGTIRISTGRVRDGERVDRLRLEPAEGAIVTA